jgi:release factor glutamine methyltransferase
MFLCCMKTVNEAYDVFKRELAPVYSSPEAEALTSLILTEATGLSKASLKAFTDTELNVVQSERLLTLLEELKTGKPVQYVLGHTEFYGLPFEVNPSVLIPRPETEELVEWILQTLPPNSKHTILDIGTGSGCIPIVLKSKLIHSQLTAIDISPKALQTAIRNATLNNVEVTFVEADIFNLKDSEITTQQYNIIISNPPYVTHTDKLQMHWNVTDYEPHTALFVPDHEPLLFYNAIANFAINNLVSGGYLFFEINESFGAETVAMLANKGFQNIELRQDMADKDRMIKAGWLR